jgi:hypothetical protein
MTSAGSPSVRYTDQRSSSAGSQSASHSAHSQIRATFLGAHGSGLTRVLALQRELCLPRLVSSPAPGGSIDGLRAFSRNPGRRASPVSVLSLSAFQATNTAPTIAGGTRTHDEREDTGSAGHPRECRTDVQAGRAERLLNTLFSTVCRLMDRTRR